MFVLSISLGSFMMVANIIIGWIAVRDATEAIVPYPSKLYAIDLLVIFVFFGMNNVIIYALGIGYSAFDPQTLSKILIKGVEADKVSFTITIFTNIHSDSNRTLNRNSKKLYFFDKLLN
ncbi:hypothetical protein [uncultured Paraglaciecola sp.]|uniref:hypothetical protein n=1 Tax=uncultured Paraglaciecola sp. TaxID=1765024 RepID=UPI002624EEBD|nr:hypothetical protein [uncultured Paraglaciecola sp.]